MPVRPLGAVASRIAPLALVFCLAFAAPALASDEHELGPGEKLQEVTVPDRAALDALVAGYDVAETLTKNDDGTLTTEVYGTPDELTELEAKGYELGEVIESTAIRAQRLAEREQAMAVTERTQTLAEDGRSAQQRAAAATDVVIQRADIFQNYGGRFVYAEARTNLGTTGSGTMAMSWNTGEGTEYGAAVTMGRFNDAGQYMYHLYLARIPDGTPMPTKVRIASSFGGVAENDTEEWLGGGLPPYGDGYIQDFHTSYMDPTQLQARFDAIESEFGDIAEQVALPNQTNGYRRRAMGLLWYNGAAVPPGPGNPAVIGNLTSTAAAGAIVLTTKAWGHEGGNDVWVELTGGTGSDQPLSVAVAGKTIAITLATDASGAPYSSAAQVVGAINADPAASALVTATTYRGNAGSAVVQPRPPVRLSDYLNAPASVQRGPFQPKALRIGKHRDGSKVGVFIYCQQHAREWVTPLTCLETAERLVRNYATDPATKELVDNLDIFIVPSVNPDGSHYSFYDNGGQRRNMTYHCLNNAFNDSAARNAWGVDLNRNSTVGSLFDGYSGASTNCTNDTFAGPSEASEPEIKNELWIVDTFSNIKFAINIHSHGGYFMWSPGAYQVPGRIALPHPNIGVEGYFWEAADKVLNRIKEYRGTVIVPERTGPIADVLYSAAGNSADDQWYRKGIISYSFEVGAQRFNPDTNRWSDVGFQPVYRDEGHDEAMEFAAGNYGLLESALDYSRDTTPPEAITVADTEESNGPIDVTFDWVNEASVIHYTTDGSTPTLASPTWEAQGPRQPGEVLTFDTTTTLKWIAVDIKGNVSAAQSQTYLIETAPPVTTHALSSEPPDGLGGAYLDPVTITLTASDEVGGSGVAKTEYAVDGGPWQTYKVPFTIATPGQHTVAYRSTDDACNVELAKTLTFTIAHTTGAEGSVGGTVPGTLSLSIAGPASFGAFTPGVAKDYATSLAAVVTTTAENTTLSVHDPSGVATGRLVNGAYALQSPVQASGGSGPFGAVGGSDARRALLTFRGPVSNDPVTIGLKQSIAANEPLRTGSYGKTLTFTLSTTTP
jgi:Zinc carboxypeptidase/Chitobiase/beta-hexosaminidase C-terminal domain